MKNKIILIFASLFLIVGSLNAQIYSSNNNELDTVKNNLRNEAYKNFTVKTLKDYTVPDSAALISIISMFDDAFDNTISLPTPVDSLKGNIIEITHLDTSAGQARTTTVETDVTSYHLYDNFTGDTLTFFNIYQSGQTVRFTLQEIEGTLRWVTVNLSPIVFGDKELNAVGSVRQDGDGNLYGKFGAEDTRIQYNIRYDSISNINPKLPLNSRFYVGETDFFYDVQIDTVEFYAVDEKLVVTLDNKYAVADLSEKRNFEKIDEFERETPLLYLEDGEKISINGISYEAKYSPKYFHYLFSQDNFNKDSLPDNILYRTAKNGFGIRNHVISSDRVLNTTKPFPIGSFADYIWGNGNAGTIIQNEEINPFGAYEAEAIIGFNSTSQNAFRVRLNPIGFSSGDTYTFSFWAKMNKTTGINERMIITNFAGNTNPVTSEISIITDGKWHRYTITDTIGIDPTPPYEIFTILGGFADQDTMYVSRFNFVKGNGYNFDIKSNYDFTQKNKLHLYTDIIENNTLDLSKIIPNGSSVDGIIIQKAIDFCASGERCNKVVLPNRTYRVSNPIYMKSGVRVLGGSKAYRAYTSASPKRNYAPIIQIDSFVDKTKYVFYFEPTSSQSVISQTGLENMYIETLDTIAGFIQTNEIAASNIEYITMQVAGGKIDSCGFDMNVTPPSDNHYNTIRFITTGESPVGLRYDGGIANTFEQISVGSADTGLIVNGGLFDVDKISVEGANIGVINKGGILSIDKIYSEASASEGGPTIYQENGSTYILNSRLQVTNANTDTLIKVTGGDYFEVNNSQIVIGGLIRIDSGGVEKATFRSVGSLIPLEQRIENINSLKDKVEIHQNYRTFNSEILARNLIGATKLNEAFLNASGLGSGSFVADTIGYSGIYFKSMSRNLINQSDSLGTDQTTAIFNTYNNVTNDPFGGNDGDVISVNTNASSVFVSNKTAIKDFEVGEIYTVSVYLKNLREDKLSTTDVILRLGNLGPEAVFYNISNKWQRYERQIRATVSNTNCALRLNNLELGDSIAISRFVVNKGTGAIRGVKTTNQGDNIIQDAKFEGNLTAPNIDTLETPSYANLFTQADTLTYTADDKEKIQAWQTQALSTHYSYATGNLTYTGNNEVTEIEYKVTVTDTDIFENFELAVYVGGVVVPALTDSYTFSATDTSHTFTGKAIVDVDNTDTIFFEGRFPGGNQNGDVIISRASAVLSRKKLR